VSNYKAYYVLISQDEALRIWQCTHASNIDILDIFWYGCKRLSDIITYLNLGYTFHTMQRLPFGQIEHFILNFQLQYDPESTSALGYLGCQEIGTEDLNFHNYIATIQKFYHLPSPLHAIKIAIFLYIELLDMEEQGIHFLIRRKTPDKIYSTRIHINICESAHRPLPF